MTSIEEDFPLQTENDNITTTDWALGSREKSLHTEITYDAAANKVGFAEVSFAPAWYKLNDEILVNAVDHAVRNPTVRNINVTFAADGTMGVYNDGPGIPVKIHNAATKKFGETHYVSTLLFGHLFQGTNSKKDDTKTNDIRAVVGGVNGLGGKLVNTFSKRFLVDQADGELQLTQQWTDNRENRSSATVKPSRKSYTHITFLPDFKLFKWEWTHQDYDSLLPVIAGRCLMAACYLNEHVKQQVKITINGLPIKVKTTQQLAKMLFPECKTFTCEISLPQAKDNTKDSINYKWNITMCITPVAPIGTMSVINGMNVTAGTHFKHVHKILNEHVAKKLSSTFGSGDVKYPTGWLKQNSFLIINAQIPYPSWTGQRKDEISTSTTKYTKDIPAVFLNGITAAAREDILEQAMETTTSTTKKKEKLPESYIPAKHLGRKSGLMVTEGNSAATAAQSAAAKTISLNHLGLFPLKGVIVNARKNVSIVQTPNGRKVIRSTKFKNSVVINHVLQILNLNIDYEYDPADKQQLKKLNYGFIVGCVDQDPDGKGQILGLIMSMIHHIWPKLYAQDFVRWFETPLVRFYPINKKGKLPVMVFYSMESANEWANKKIPGYDDPVYYKGLATHSPKEAEEMFKQFYERLHAFTLDEKSQETFEIFYGLSADARKLELATAALPVKEFKGPINSTHHLRSETKLFQLSNLEQKLPHVIDGQNQSSRMIVHHLTRTLHSTKPRYRVAQLAGAISEKENYHHGESSLQGSITNRGYVATGGVQLPVIIPRSQFGSRLEGGKDAGSARYIEASINLPLTQLLFNDADYHLLPFKFENNIRHEPQYFIPVIPLAILESQSMPGTGWKLEVWARCVFDVISIVRKQILGYKINREPKPASYPGYFHKWTGTWIDIGGSIYSRGVYHYKPETNEVVITELPIGVWTNPYVASLKSIYIADIDARSCTDERVWIVIKLTDGACEDIVKQSWSVFDGFEYVFGLYKKHTTHLNVMNIDGGVTMCRKYNEIIQTWFPIRKQMYADRCERQCVLMRLGISLIENKIKYINADFDFRKKSISYMNATLVSAGFVKFKAGLIASPGFIPTDELVSAITGDDASYEYLLKMHALKISDAALAKLQAKLDDARTTYDTFVKMMNSGSFVGSNIWLDELDQLENVIRCGAANKWEEQ